MPWNKSRVYYAVSAVVQFILAIFCILLAYIGNKKLFNEFREAYFDSLRAIKVSKQEIADWYGVSRKTLNKWIKTFVKNVDFEAFKRRKKATLLDFEFIKASLGNPELQPCLLKREIAEKCETYYHTIRENVELNLKKIGFSKETYKSFDVFPPKVSLQIVQMLG